MEKASSLFENLYKCIRQTALSDPYKAADETYYKILVPEKIAVNGARCMRLALPSWFAP